MPIRQKWEQFRGLFALFGQLNELENYLWPPCGCNFFLSRPKFHPKIFWTAKISHFDPRKVLVTKSSSTIRQREPERADARSWALLATITSLEAEHEEFWKKSSRGYTYLWIRRGCRRLDSTTFSWRDRCPNDAKEIMVNERSLPTIKYEKAPKDLRGGTREQLEMKLRAALVARSPCWSCMGSNWKTKITLQEKEARISSGTYRLTIIDDIHACLMHVGVELLPGVSSISWPVDCSCVRLNQNDFIGVTAPHDVLQWTVNLEDLETNFVCLYCINLINHISCTSVCQKAQGCEGNKALARIEKPAISMIVSLMFALIHLRIAAWTKW